MAHEKKSNKVLNSPVGDVNVTVRVGCTIFFRIFLAFSKRKRKHLVTFDGRDEVGEKFSYKKTR